MRLARALLLLLSSASAQLLAQENAGHLGLALPTANEALFHGGGAAFYQYIIRDYQGVITKPWQGGQYGFVRNPVETPGGLVYTRFHEGMDIRPLQRDANGEPLDEVRAIAEGTVVYTNLVAAHSNYGNYVVVEHHWDGSSYYSLYGHLASVKVQRGAKVQRGEQLGVIGYTGEGLDRERAHVHLELNLLLSRRFDAWYDLYNKTEPNYHGLYNGINLMGIDVARLFLALRKEPSLTIPEFLAQEETFYKVTLPGGRALDLVRRYPWLLRGANRMSAQAWEVSFNRAGVPLKVEARDTSVTAPTLSFVKQGGSDYALLTRGVLAGAGSSSRLSETGERLMRLLVLPRVN